MFFPGYFFAPSAFFVYKDRKTLYDIEEELRGYPS